MAAILGDRESVFIERALRWHIDQLFKMNPSLRDEIEAFLALRGKIKRP